MADKDANQEAEELVRKITESDRAKGEDLLGSEKLKRQLREALRGQTQERDSHPGPSAMVEAAMKTDGEVLTKPSIALAAIHMHPTL